MRDTNQVANYTLLEWDDNMSIGDLPPAEYVSIYSNRFDTWQLDRMMDLHALPAGWETMRYPEFLAKRRRLMAGVIRRGFEMLLPDG